MSSTSEHKHPGGVLRHDHEPTTGDKIGEAVGGVSGALTGAAVGSPAGPIGTIIGGIAGAVGGWWAGRTVAEAAAKFNEHDDNNYRQAYEARPDRLVDRSYEDVRPAYQLGHLASENPDYTGKNFESIEMDLQGDGETFRGRGIHEQDFSDRSRSSESNSEFAGKSRRSGGGHYEVISGLLMSYSVTHKQSWIPGCQK
jgi:hypothetical protein